MAGVYIHFPFCKKKCLYCDFFSKANQDFLIPDFLEALTREISLRADIFSPIDETVDTIYFGGGTPSLLKPEQIEDVLNSLLSVFPVINNAEITVEANPGTLSFDLLRGYREIGINRLSIGVQSFNNGELKFLGRIHTAEQAEEFFFEAQRAGFDEIGIDLIYSLPEQSLIEWQGNVDKVFSLKPTHISTYALTWSSATPLGRAIEEGKCPRPDDETTAEMYLLTRKVLSEVGYEHYEISNFALPGHRCRHNEGYWTGKPYFGLGPSAHSYIKDRRFWNISDIRKYINVLLHNELPVDGEERLNPRQKFLERIALGLRRREGIPIEALKNKRQEITHLVQAGLAVLKGGFLSLTVRGFLLADEIALRLVL